MKKIISLCLILVLSLGLVACGGKEDNNKAALDKANAVKLTMEELVEAIDFNQAKAAQYIDNKTYCITGYASEITADYVVLFAEAGEKSNVNHYEKEIDKKLEWEYVVYAYMPTAELAKINTNDRITIYGVFTETNVDDMGDKIDRTYLKLDNAEF